MIRTENLTKHFGATPHAVKLLFCGDVDWSKQQDTEDEIAEVSFFSPEEIYAMGSDKLRDEDIKDEVRDYLDGRRFPLDTIRHWVVNEEA